MNKTFKEEFEATFKEAVFDEVYVTSLVLEAKEKLLAAAREGSRRTYVWPPSRPVDRVEFIKRLRAEGIELTLPDFTRPNDFFKLEIPA